MIVLKSVSFEHVDVGAGKESSSLTDDCPCNRQYKSRWVLNHTSPKESYAKTRV